MEEGEVTRQNTIHKEEQRRWHSPVFLPCGHAFLNISSLQCMGIRLFLASIGGTMEHANPCRDIIA